MGAGVGSGVEPVKGVRGESPCHVTPFLTSQMFGKFIITCTVLSVHGMELSLAPWVTQKWSRDHICGLRGQTMNTWTSAVYRNPGDGGLWFLKTLETGGSREPTQLSKTMRNQPTCGHTSFSVTLVIFFLRWKTFENGCLQESI